MGFTIRRVDSSEFIDDSEIKALVEAQYDSPMDGEPANPGDGFQFEYDDLQSEEIDDVFGAVAKANAPIGVYADIDPIEKGDFYIFSITRLAGQLESKETPKVGFFERLFGMRGQGWAKKELIDAIVQIASTPAKGYPAVTIWW